MKTIQRIDGEKLKLVKKDKFRTLIFSHEKRLHLKFERYAYRTKKMSY